MGELTSMRQAVRRVSLGISFNLMYLYSPFAVCFLVCLYLPFMMCLAIHLSPRGECSVGQLVAQPLRRAEKLPAFVAAQ